MIQLSTPVVQRLPLYTHHNSTFRNYATWVTEVPRWQLVEDWFYQFPGTASSDPVLVGVPKGFVFDGASVPRLLWAALNPTGLLLKPGLLHDFAYRYGYLWAVDISFKGKALPIARRWADVGKITDCHRPWDRMFYEVGKRVNNLAALDLLATAAVYCCGGKAWRKQRNDPQPEIFFKDCTDMGWRHKPIPWLAKST